MFKQVYGKQICIHCYPNAKFLHNFIFTIVISHLVYNKN